MLQLRSIRPLAPAVLALLVCGAAAADEWALLQTGRRLRAERHDLIGDRVRLYSAGGAFTELAASLIVRFEPIVPIESEPAPEAALPEKSLDEAIEEISQRIGLPAALVHSVISAESAYDPAAISPKGAVGLMQLMPETARELEVDPHQPHQNVNGGVRYLRLMLDRYEGSGDQLVRALAAYNAGPGAVDRYEGLPPYNETRAFVRRVLRRFLEISE